MRNIIGTNEYII